MRIYVPGNLLLTGEYAVTCTGCMGIAAAVSPSLVIDAVPSDRLSISGSFEKHQYTWNQGDPFPEELSLLRVILQRVQPTTPYKIKIDSSAFSHPDGSKKGYGSSAAVTVGLVALFLKDHPEDVLKLSLEIHRAFQGGRGSGYDIFASYHGGVGLFMGGVFPSWTPITPFWKDHLYLLKGDGPISTRGILGRFDSFLAEQPEKAAQFLRLSNCLTQDLIKGANQQQALRTYRRAAALNRWINRQINLKSESALLQTLRKRGSAAKSLGSGNELAALLSFENESRYQPLEISKEGLRCAI